MELAGVAAFLYTTLTTDPDVAALVGDRVFEDAADEDATYPLVVFNLMAGTDAIAVGGGARIWTHPLYQVRVIVKDAGYSVADPIAHAVDAALTGALGPVDVDGFTVQVDGCDREQPLRRMEQISGTRWFNVGGLYRLIAYEI